MSFAQVWFRRPLVHVIVSVHPARRFLDVRTWLIQEAIEVATTCDTERLVVDCLSDSEGSLADAIGKLNFREARTFKRYVGDSRTKYGNLVVMAKNQPLDYRVLRSPGLDTIRDFLKEDELVDVDAVCLPKAAHSIG